MVTDGFHHRDDPVVVSDRLLPLALYLVGYLAGVDHLVHFFLDEDRAVRYILDDLHVLGG